MGKDGRLKRDKEPGIYPKDAIDFYDNKFACFHILAGYLIKNKRLLIDLAVVSVLTEG